MFVIFFSYTLISEQKAKSTRSHPSRRWGGLFFCDFPNFLRLIDFKEMGHRLVKIELNPFYSRMFIMLEAGLHKMVCISGSQTKQNLTMFNYHDLYCGCLYKTVE